MSPGLLTQGRSIKKIEHAVQSAVLDAAVHHLTQHRLGVEGDAETGCFQHLNIVGTVASGNDLLCCQAEFVANAQQVASFGGTVDDLSYDRIYSAWWDRVMTSDAKARVHASAARYVAAIA